VEKNIESLPLPEPSSITKESGVISLAKKTANCDGILGADFP
tara:strand:+ start:723 stop:848 length:126 start_codon:yes stop_codon:yes gene_type:complete